MLLFTISGERDARIHGKQGHDADHVMEQIIWEVRVKISQLKNIKFDNVNEFLIQSWYLAESNFYNALFLAADSKNCT